MAETVSWFGRRTRELFVGCQSLGRTCIYLVFYCCLSKTTKKRSSVNAYQHQSVIILIMILPIVHLFHHKIHVVGHLPWQRELFPSSVVESADSFTEHTQKISRHESVFSVSARRLVDSARLLFREWNDSSGECMRSQAPSLGDRTY